MERRAAVRFLLHAPVIIRWTDASGAKREDVGRTRDISTSGAFLTCHAELRVGTKLGIEIPLPPLERNSLQRVRLQSKGKVLRVTRKDEQTGVALSAQFTLHDNCLQEVGSQQT
jgi:hypothetical protein